MPSEYPLVKIEWLDAMTPVGAWRSEAELCPQPTVVISVGFLVNKTLEYATLAGSIGDIVDHQPAYGSIIHIPAGTIRSIKKLRTSGPYGLETKTTDIAGIVNPDSDPIEVSDPV